MKSEKLLPNKAETEKLTMPTRSQQQQPQPSDEENSTLGQRLADKLASKVGSWGFLIAQTGFLTGWVTLNSIPGVPHWDQSPFILLNLMFSFASAYTAPIVLMSQNRQSDMERQNAAIDHEVNRKAERNIGLLHEKMDSLQSQQLKELTQIVKQQQQALHEIKVSVLPVLQQQQQAINEIKASVVPALQQQQAINEIKLGVVPGLNDQTSGKFPQEVSVYIPFKFNHSMGDNSQHEHVRQSD